MEGRQLEDEKYIASFNHNSENFRSLNQLMWQIPLLAMTLTGGLWFGVSKVDDSKIFQACLLVLATLGNIGLIIALRRLRFVMGKYLEWFESKHPAGYVRAKGDGIWSGDGWFTGSHTVRCVFEFLLGLAGAISLLLLINIMMRSENISTSLSSVAYYDRHALDLADSYEAVAFEDAHPELSKVFVAGQKFDVLDVGAGSGRDASWMQRHGQNVTAVEPSAKMINLAKHLHGDETIEWLSDSLPALSELGHQKFDLVFLSAVWMHLDPKAQEASFLRFNSVLRKNGVIYMTLRLGPVDKERSIFSNSLKALREISASNGFKVEALSHGPDLLGRNEIIWQRVALHRLQEQPMMLLPPK